MQKKPYIPKPVQWKHHDIVKKVIEQETGPLEPVVHSNMFAGTLIEEKAEQIS